MKPRSTQKTEQKPNDLIFTLLLQGIKNNKISLVQKNIDACIHTRETSGLTPLMYALNLRLAKDYIPNEENKKIVELILDATIKHKVDLNLFSKEGFTALHSAVCTNDFETAKKLVEAKADINQADFKQNTPLLHAINRLNLPISELLLKHKADFHHYNYQFITPLHAAMQRKNMPLLKLLLDHKADPVYFPKLGYSSALESSIQDNFKDFFPELLLACKTRNLNLEVENMCTLLDSSAASPDRLFYLNALLEAGANPLRQKNYMRTIQQTILQNNTEAFAKLLPIYAEGKKINDLVEYSYAIPGKSEQIHCSLLTYAIILNRVEMTQELLKNGADPTLHLDHLNPFHETIKSGNMELFHLVTNAILEKKGEFTPKLKNGSPVIHWAIEKDNMEILNTLLKLNLDVLETLKIYSTGYDFDALMFAISKKNYRMIERLMAHYTEKGIPYLNTHNGYLIAAILTQDADVVEYLLAKGFTLVETSNHLHDPLFYAIKPSSSKIIINKLAGLYEQQNLLNKISKSTPQFRFTPLTIAIHRKDLSAIKTLLEHKADTGLVVMGQTAFTQGITANFYPCTKLFLDFGIAPDDLDKQILMKFLRNGTFNMLDAIKDNHYDFLALMENKLPEVSQKMDKTKLLEVAKITGKHKEIDKMFQHTENISLNLLQIAVILNNVEMIKFLLKSNFACDTPHGKSPIDLAKRMGTKNTEKLLRQHMRAKLKMELKKESPSDPAIEQKAEPKKPSVKPKEKISDAKYIEIHKDKISTLNKTKAKKLLFCLAKELPDDLSQEQIKKLANRITKNTKNLKGEDIAHIIHALTQLEYDVAYLNDKDDLIILLKAAANSEKDISLSALLSILENMLDLGFTLETLDAQNLTFTLLNKISQTLKTKFDAEIAAKILENLYELGIHKNLFHEHGLSLLLCNLAFKNQHLSALQLLQNLKFHHQEFKLAIAPESFGKLLTHQDMATTKIILNTFVSMKFPRKSLDKINEPLLQILQNLQQLPIDEWNSFPHLLWTYARLGFLAKDFTPMMQESLQNLYLKANENFSLKDTALILWSLSVMNFTKTDSVYKTLAPSCLEIINETRNFDDKTATQLQQASVWFDVQLEEKTTYKISAVLAQQTPTTSSELHKNVAKILSGLIQKNKLPEFENEFKIADCMSADMCFVNAKLIVEVDGPDHTPALDAFKNRLLKKQGYTVIRLNHQELGDLRDIARAEALLTKKVLAILKDPLQRGQFFKPAMNDKGKPESQAPKRTFQG